jgi:xylulokinase
MLCGLADAVDALRRHGAEPRRVVLIGGAARSRAVQRIATELLGLEITVPEPGEYVALGAARQAAWTLAGSDQPPAWPIDGHRVEPDPARTATGEQTRARYRAVLGGAGPLLSGGQTISL